ncbi:MAG: UDP-N-acetylmuramate--L-alanine ligase [Bradymonadia bacterium]
MTKPHQPWYIRREMPTDVQKVHLIGVAGAGMGAFACMLQEAGFEVRGSDLNVYPPMSDVLRSRGISWFEGWHADHLGWGPDLVIVGNVCRRDNPESVAAHEGGLATVSFPQALSDLFLRSRHPVVISGTHGKTTTTALTTWLLHAGGLQPGMLVGGVTHNFDATYLIGSEGGPFVVEGDEYDTAWFDKGPKFLHYRAQTCVLNNIEFDHADIYDDLAEIIENFERLMGQLGPRTHLLANVDDPLVVERAQLARGRVTYYGFGPGASLRAVDEAPEGAGFAFTLVKDNRELGRIVSPLAGRHNIWNTLAAFGVGLELGLSVAQLSQALAGFTGVKKRQEEKGEASGVLVVDDYAHHPTAIAETLRALKARYAGRRLWAIYEAKSNTARRNVHQQAYAEAFDAADQVVFARPYIKKDNLADEEKLDVDQLVADIESRGASAIYRATVEEIIEHLVEHAQAGDVVVFMSSSGFGGIHQRTLDALAAR